MELYLATNGGLAIAGQENGAWRVLRRELDGRNTTSVIAREGVILAGTKDGIFASGDGGQTWAENSDGLNIRHVRWLAYHPNVSDFEFAGTEPAGIFISRDGGATWRERPEVVRLRDQFGWWLPYSPEAGCVRDLAFHGKRAYAAVEVGGALRSDDGGESWQLAPGSDGQPKFGRPQPGFVHPDVHSIEVHPSSPDLVLAPTGGGFYRSGDGGQTWTLIYDDCYVRAVWVDPADPGHMILGPAHDPSGHNGRIEESRDNGQTWNPLTETWQRNMVERFFQVDDTLLAVMSNGQLLSASLDQLSWQPILTDVANINAVTVMV